MRSFYEVVLCLNCLFYSVKSILIQYQIGLTTNWVICTKTGKLGDKTIDDKLMHSQCGLTLMVDSKLRL